MTQTIELAPMRAKGKDRKNKMTDSVNQKKLKIFFMVEPEPLEAQAHLLIASLKLNCQDDYALQAFCRDSKIQDLSAETRTFFEAHGVALSTIQNTFEDGYPAGNKLFASAAVSGADWYLWLDTDMVMIQPAHILDQTHDDHASICLDTINGWSLEPEQWNFLFGTYDLCPPPAIENFGYEKQASPPIFNAGFLLFPEMKADIPHFGERWLETALRIDQEDRVINKRPWLDTIAIPVTFARSSDIGLNTIDRAWNNTVKHSDENSVFIHYHGLTQLNRHGRLEDVNALLKKSISPFESVNQMVKYFRRKLKKPGKLYMRAMRYALRED